MEELHLGIPGKIGDVERTRRLDDHAGNPHDQTVRRHHHFLHVVVQQQKLTTSSVYECKCRS